MNMRGLCLLSIALAIGGCSLTPLTQALGLREATIEKIDAPSRVKAGAPIKVTWTVYQPSSCETFSHVELERREAGRHYVVRAYNRLGTWSTNPSEERCALVAGYTVGESVLEGAPSGTVTITDPHASRPIVIVIE
jgi:hypothetical protein